MNISQSAYDKVMQSWWLLKLTYGLVFVIAGADKFFNLITSWPKYLSPVIAQMIPLTVEHIMVGTALFEIALGILILTVATRMGAYVAMLWLLVMAGNLVTFGIYNDIAIRDAVMAIGALVLALLTDVHEERKQ